VSARSKGNLGCRPLPVPDAEDLLGIGADDQVDGVVRAEFQRGERLGNLVRLVDGQKMPRGRRYSWEYFSIASPTVGS
jgi:hypothetical protein